MQVVAALSASRDEGLGETALQIGNVSAERGQVGRIHVDAVLVGRIHAARSRAALDLQGTLQTTLQLDRLDRCREEPRGGPLEQALETTLESGDEAHSGGRESSRRLPLA